MIPNATRLAMYLPSVGYSSGTENSYTADFMMIATASARERKANANTIFLCRSGTVIKGRRNHTMTGSRFVGPKVRANSAEFAPQSMRHTIAMS